MDTSKLTDLVTHLDYGPAPESNAKAIEWLENHGRKFDHFINGKFVKPKRKEYFETINPAIGEVLAELALGSEKDINAAVQSAAAAFPIWSGLSGYARAKYLYAIARAIAKHARLFAVLESMDNGKTIRETRDIDIPLVIRHFYYHAGWAQIAEHEFPNHRPGGVVAQIIPWNFPMLMLAWKIAPAIAVGNTCVLKPAEFTPLTALLFAEILMNEVRLPAGVVNIVTGGGETGPHLVNHTEPWKIAFTGSTEVGRMIRNATAGKEKHLTLELGGKSPFIVFQNADLDSAVEGVVNAIWFNQGQVCCAGSRLLIEESIYDDFINRLKLRMTKLRGGQPLDKTMDIGAINSEQQLKKIQHLCKLGQEEGAQMWQPDTWTQPVSGYFFPPTLFTHVEPAHTIAIEEIFGPVLVCMSFRTPAEAVQLANNTRFGLAASIWSQDINLSMDVARKVKAGSVWINSTNLFDAASGFGGYRESGYGREGGREGILEVLEEQITSSKLKIKKIKFVESTKIKTQNLKSEIQIDRTLRFLIGGKLVRPDQQLSIEITSPSGELLGVVGDANRKDVRNAVESARNAFTIWFEQSAHLRSQILFFFAENLALHVDRFANVIAAQTGRTIDDSMHEVNVSIERLFYYAALTDKFEGTVQPVPGRMMVAAMKEPIGVVGIRACDEYPLLGLIATLAPAIAMGNTIAMVAGKYSLTAMDLIQVIQNSDVPAGVINIFCAGDPDSIAKILSEHEDVDAVWYFGSKNGSAEIERASISNMKRTWVSNGKPIDWFGVQGVSKRFLREATQVKNIWVPYGV